MSTSSMRKFQHRKDLWPRRLLLALIILFPCFCIFSLFAVLKRALDSHYTRTSGTPTPHTSPGGSIPPLAAVQPLSAKWSAGTSVSDPDLPHFTLDSVPEYRTTASSHYDATDYAQQLLHARPISPRSLAVILPVTSQSLSHLETTILSLYQDPGAVTEIIVLAYEPILSLTRRTLRTIMTTISPNPDIMFPTEITLRNWKPILTQAEASLRCMSRNSGTSEWVLVLDQRYLEGVGEEMRSMLLSPPNVSFPLGIRGSGVGEREVLSYAGLRGFEEDGVAREVDYQEVSPCEEPRPVSFLVPPFVLPTRLLGDNIDRTSPPNLKDTDTHLSSWAAFGHWISRTRADKIGGVAIGYGEASSTTSGYHTQHGRGDATNDQWTADSGVLSSLPLAQTSLSQTRLLGMFGMLMYSLEDLARFAPVACRLVKDGHQVELLLYGQGRSRSILDPDIEHGNKMFVEGTVSGPGKCDLRYRSVAEQDRPPYRTLAIWLDGFKESPDVLVASVEDDIFGATLSTQLKERRWDKMATLIRLPRDDLPYSDWMGTLSLEEWKHWNIPHIDLSVITDSRPASLGRLLSSLQNARYFGDKPRLRINIEDSADEETLSMIDQFEWLGGAENVFVHHRVVHGGLLPAVVESWYPSSDDSYGLLLEDDVELSPLFYAWAKMNVLHYRYGKSSDKSSSLFGISLFQQKSIELRPEGRTPFHPRQLFAHSGLEHPNTPYLSQIPCSWGAIYFPSQWREFHAYLSLRLSGLDPSSPHHLPSEDVAVDVRSNRWKHSWKKYFIELAYLRGYVMLYPNFADFKSLSTNHLEVGSHVKKTPRAIYDKKKALFNLPLMPLPNVNMTLPPSVFPSMGEDPEKMRELEGGTWRIVEPLQTGLLDLPEGRLPSWRDMPVLDLHGEFASGLEIKERGAARRMELLGCSTSSFQSGHGPAYNASALLCLTP